MIEIILVALGTVVVGGSVYYLMNKRVREISDKLAKAENEATSAKGFQEVAEEQADTLRKKYNEFVSDAKKKMEEAKINLEEKYKKDADLRIERILRDYEEALKLETDELEEKVHELDEQLGIKIQEITAKNTMRFTCACDRTKYIPCTIDLSDDENYFTCPDCGAVYKVIVSASTILMSGITNNPKIANMYDGIEVGESDRTSL